MPAVHSRKVIAVLEDLMFGIKISEAAKRLGLHTEFVRTQEEALSKARELPLLVVLDLNYSAASPVPLIAQLKQDPETKSVPLLAFVSHVHAELKQKAQEAGAEMVLARSAFSQNLPQILKRHAQAS